MQRFGFGWTICVLCTHKYKIKKPNILQNHLFITKELFDYQLTKNMGSIAAYSGQETGNLLIYDKEMTDPTVWQPLKVDKAKRWRYPSLVGNTYRNITEQVVTAGGALTSAQFMTGRIVFKAGAQGTTVSLPSQLVMMQMLQKYYAQIHKREGPYAASNGNSNQIANSIDVEFFNDTGDLASPVTLDLSGITTRVTGLPSSLRLPLGATASIRFTVLTTFPPTFSATLSGGNMSFYDVAQRIPNNFFLNDATDTIAAGQTEVVGTAAPTSWSFQGLVLQPVPVTVSSGVFTVLDIGKTLNINFQGTVSAAVAGGYFSLRQGSTNAGTEIARSGVTDPNLTVSFSHPFVSSAVAGAGVGQGPTFVITYTNPTGAGITVVGANNTTAYWTKLSVTDY